MEKSILYAKITVSKKNCFKTKCDDPGLRDRNLTQIRNTKTDVTKYKFIAVKPNQVTANERVNCKYKCIMTY